MIHDIIKNRYSTRAFSGELPDEETILRLFDAARWAPSSMNEQPWRFIVVTKDDKENYYNLLSTLSERNRIWAARAPILILALAKVDSTGYNSNLLSLYDLGMAVENLSLQATAENLCTHQMGGFDREKAKKSLEIPDGYFPMVVIAVGRKGNIDELPDFLKNRELAERKRIPLNEILFEGKFGMHDKITGKLNNYD